MKEKIIAKVYANTFIELGKDQNVDVAKELTVLSETISASNDLENVLFLEIFTDEEKSDVFKKIAEKLGLAPIIVSAVLYLIEEKRIGLFPMIFKEIIVADDDEKGFMRGTIEGQTDAIDENLKAKLLARLESELKGRKAILNYKKNEEITSGYRVTMGDLQLDATVDNQLERFRESVLGK